MPPLTARPVTSSGFTFAKPASLLRNRKSSCLRVPTSVLPKSVPGVLSASSRGFGSLSSTLPQAASVSAASRARMNRVMVFAPWPPSYPPR